MRDRSEDSNSSGWPLYSEDKTLSGGQYYNSFLPRAMAVSYSGYEQNLLKQTMLQHDAIFKNQVYELHHLYRTQRNLMGDVKGKELNKDLNHTNLEESQTTSENPGKWKMLSLLMANSVCGRPPVPGCSLQACSIPSRGISSEDFEVLEVRPMQFRRKMIDLQLPGNGYIDMEETEQTQYDTRGLPMGNQKAENKTGQQLFLEGEKPSYRKDSLRSSLGLRSSNCFADLNEPIMDQETEPVCTFKETYSKSTSGRNNVHVEDSFLEENKSQTGWQILGPGHDKISQKPVSQNFRPDKLHPSSQSGHVLSINANEPPGYPSIDHGMANFFREKTFLDFNSSARNLEVSYDSHVESSVASNAPSSHNHCPSFGRPWSHLLSSWENPSFSISQKSKSIHPHPFLNSFEVRDGNTLVRTPRQGLCGGRWHPDSNSRTNPSYVSRCPGRNRFYHGSSSGSKETALNLSSVGFNHFDVRSGNAAFSEQIKDCSTTNFYKDINFLDTKFPNDQRLSGALSNNKFNKVETQQDLESRHRGRKPEEHLASLPWLKGKSACNSKITNGHFDLNAGDGTIMDSSPNQFSLETGGGKGLNHMSAQQSLKSVSCSNDIDTSRIKIADCQSNRKILGFPIFDKPSGCKEECYSLTSPSMHMPCQPKEEDEAKPREIDINLPCNPAISLSDQHSTDFLVIEMEADRKVSSFRHQINLNSSVSEDEDCCEPLSLRAETKVIPWIDLEAPPLLETEDDIVCEEKSSEKVIEECWQLSKGEDENLMDELIKTAAEAIVDISFSCHQTHLDEASSSSREASRKDLLLWFAETVESCGKDLEKNIRSFSRKKDNEVNREECSPGGFDYFEKMTLNLPETKEEDYMPEPLIPETLKLEETGQTVIPNRPRRGHARRGRQRRDFQRDILPTLASLSSHEVTEDLQTFGGIMRATGHSWDLGLTRRTSNRKGSNRGRRRFVNNNNNGNTSRACSLSVKQVNKSIEAVKLEDRSLAGWGKTTRRPRRQRCHAGNPPTVVLT